MQVVDPGHSYLLHELDDGEPDETLHIGFVKRTGDGYPGNQPPPYPGTIIQEVLRACTDRLRYVIKQGESLGSNEFESKETLAHLRAALWFLEVRAAQRHGKPLPSIDEAEFGPICSVCGHVVCADTCAGKSQEG